MPTKPTLVLTYEIHADRQRVFDVLTQPGHLNSYFTTDARVDLQVGGRYTNGDGESGKFLKVAVPRNLTCTYTHARLGFDTELDITLKPSLPLGWTQFRLVHKGLDPARITPDTHAWIFSRWQYLAFALKRHLSRENKIGYSGWQAIQKPVYEERP